MAACRLGRVARERRVCEWVPGRTNEVLSRWVYDGYEALDEDLGRLWADDLQCTIWVGGSTNQDL